MERRHELLFDWDETAGEAAFDRAIALIEEAEGKAGDRIRGIVFPAQIETVTPELFRKAKAYADQTGRPITTHISQSVVEFNEIVRRHGVSPVQFYDPAERVVAVLYPNHTYEKVVFDPWQQTTWDVNDTVQLDPALAEERAYSSLATQDDDTEITGYQASATTEQVTVVVHGRVDFTLLRLLPGDDAIAIFEDARNNGCAGVVFPFEPHVSETIAASPTSTQNVWRVEVVGTVAGGGQQVFIWDVDAVTGALFPVNALAQQAAASCPALGG